MTIEPGIYERVDETPNSFKLRRVGPLRTQPPKWFCDVWAAFEAERRADVPNRLFGAAINSEGDAV